jgi:hypothetical protein
MRSSLTADPFAQATSTTLPYRARIARRRAEEKEGDPLFVAE